MMATTDVMARPNFLTRLILACATGSGVPCNGNTHLCHVQAVDEGYIDCDVDQRGPDAFDHEKDDVGKEAGACQVVDRHDGPLDVAVCLVHGWLDGLPGASTFIELICASQLESSLGQGHDS